MFTRIYKEETIAEGGMRVVIADAQVVVFGLARKWRELASRRFTSISQALNTNEVTI